MVLSTPTSPSEKNKQRDNIHANGTDVVLCVHTLRAATGQKFLSDCVDELLGRQREYNVGVVACYQNAPLATAPLQKLSRNGPHKLAAVTQACTLTGVLSQALQMCDAQREASIVYFSDCPPQPTPQGATRLVEVWRAQMATTDCPHLHCIGPKGDNTLQDLVAAFRSVRPLDSRSSLSEIPESGTSALPVI